VFQIKEANMAKKELARFCSEFLPAKPDVLANIAAITDESQYVKAMVEAGAKAGFAFDEGDIREVMRSTGRSVGGELSDNQLEAVAGGRKAGTGQHEFLIIKLNDILISS
jgi:general stress protein YciG